MLVGDFLDHREAQSCAFVLGGHIGLKRTFEYVVRKPGTAVHHHQAYPARAGLPLGFDQHGMIGIGMPRAQGGILRVLQQVVQNLAQLLGVAEDVGAIGVKLGRDRHLPRVGPAAGRRA